MHRFLMFAIGSIVLFVMIGKGSHSGLPVGLDPV